jgi:hypothetical protein
MSRNDIPMKPSPSTPGNQWMDGEEVHPSRKKPMGKVIAPAWDKLEDWSE